MQIILWIILLEPRPQQKPCFSLPAVYDYITSAPPDPGKIRARYCDNFEVAVASFSAFAVYPRRTQ